jgi:hypothetical protein
MILMGGELMEIASSHFGNSDLDVILGLRINELKPGDLE